MYPTPPFTPTYRMPRPPPPPPPPPETQPGDVLACLYHCDMTCYQCKVKYLPAVVPSQFKPPKDPYYTPEVLFKQRDGYIVRRSNPAEEMLIYIDGVTANVGGTTQAGSAFVFFRPDTLSTAKYGTHSFLLETHGPMGLPQRQTIHRAKLRAALAALQLCDWNLVRLRRLVIATDSGRIVDEATRKVRLWDIQEDQDLWVLLLAEVQKFKRAGLDVFFWKIAEEHNTVAHTAASFAATSTRTGEMQVFRILRGHFYTGFMSVYYEKLGNRA